MLNLEVLVIILIFIQISSCEKSRDEAVSTRDNGSDVQMKNSRNVLDRFLNKRMEANRADGNSKAPRDEHRVAGEKNKENGEKQTEKTTKTENKDEVKLWVVPPDPADFEKWKVVRKDQATLLTQEKQRPKALQSPTVVSDAQAAQGDAFTDFDKYTNSRGILTRPRSRSPFTKPGLWEPNPDDPHSRDPANKYWYRPESVGVDWLNGQITWGAHWAVPAAGAGGTDGFSAIHFPTIGNLLNIPDDYD